MHLHLRRCLLISLSLVVAALLLSASVASAAAVRYATPGGGGTACSLGTPCLLKQAIEAASVGDEVVIEPGTHVITGTLHAAANSLNIHGQSTRPIVDVSPAAGGAGIDLGTSSGSALSNVALKVHAGDQFTHGIDIEGDDTVKDVTVSVSADGDGIWVHGGVGGLVQDVAIDTDDGRGVLVTGANVTLRHVTSRASGGIGRGLEVRSDASNTITSVAATDSIFAGAQDDLHLSNNGGLSASLYLGYDAFANVYNNESFPGNLNLGAHNVSGAPLFTAADDFHQAAGSPTIDAGSLTGSVDLDGDPRLLGSAPDIGADEFRTPATVVTGVPSNIGPTSETVVGTVNPQFAPGTAWYFAYGIDSYDHQTPAVALPTANTAQVVSATLTGLTNGATYHVRLVSTNDFAQVTTGLDAQFLLPIPPGVIADPGHGSDPGVIDPPPPSAPKLTALKQSTRRWRAKAGTTFSFTLDKAAAVTATFTRSDSGRTVGGRCVARTRANARKHACTRKVNAGSLKLSGRAGLNTLRFKGVLSKLKHLSPGSYSVAFTATAGGRTSKPTGLSFVLTA